MFPAQQAAAESFLDACRAAAIDAELATDIVRVLWEKFVLLVAVSATTAVSRRTVGAVRVNPDLRWLLGLGLRRVPRSTPARLSRAG